MDIDAARAPTMEMRRYGAASTSEELESEDFWENGPPPPPPTSQARRFPALASAAEGLARVVSDTDLGGLVNGGGAPGSPDRPGERARDAKLLMAACKLPAAGFAPPLPAGDAPLVARHQAHCTFDEFLAPDESDAQRSEIYADSTMIDACRLPRDARTFASPLAAEPAKFDPPNDEREIDDEDDAPPPPVSDDVMIDACTIPKYAASATPDPYASDFGADRDVFDDGSARETHRLADADLRRAAAGDTAAAADRDAPPPRAPETAAVSDRDLISACTLPKHAVSSTPDPYASDFGWRPPAAARDDEASWV